MLGRCEKENEKRREQRARTGHSKDATRNKKQEPETRKGTTSAHCCYIGARLLCALQMACSGVALWGSMPADSGRPAPVCFAVASYRRPFRPCHASFSPRRPPPGHLQRPKRPPGGSYDIVGPAPAGWGLALCAMAPNGLHARRAPAVARDETTDRPAPHFHPPAPRPPASSPAKFGPVQNGNIPKLCRSQPGDDPLSFVLLSHLHVVSRCCFLCCPSSSFSSLFLLLLLLLLLLVIPFGPMWSIRWAPLLSQLGPLCLVLFQVKSRETMSGGDRSKADRSADTRFASKPPVLA